MGKNEAGGRRGSWARKTRIGGWHRTEATEVTEEDLRNEALGGHRGFWARKTRIGGWHRTEATEVTEEDLRNEALG
jgi:hypothetical protein